FGRALVAGLDLAAEIDGVTEQALLAGLEVHDAGVAGIGAALVDGDRPLHQVLVARVFEAQTQERELGLNALVVDADACRLDVLVDDGQHRRLLPRQGDLVVDGVLEVVADLVGGGDRGDAGAGVEGGNRTADAPGVGAGDLLLPAALLEL